MWIEFFTVLLWIAIIAIIFTAICILPKMRQEREDQEKKIREQISTEINKKIE